MSSQLVPRAAARTLASIDKARKQIALARDAGDVDELREWRDRAAAMQHYARTRDDARALADDAGEVKLRAERALGQLDADANPPSSGGRGKTASVVEGVSDLPAATRAAWRRLGALKDGQFDRVLVELRADELSGVTTARAARVADELYPKPSRSNGGGSRQRDVTPPSDTAVFHEEAEIICPTCHGSGRVALEVTDA